MGSNEKEQIMAKLDDLVQAVKDHAVEHYDEGGWDVIVETWDDDMIRDFLKPNKDAGWGRINSAGAAIKRFRCSAVSVYADRQADAKNSAF